MIAKWWRPVVRDFTDFPNRPNHVGGTSSARIQVPRKAYGCTIFKWIYAGAGY
jgi:hypothetical protein